MLLALLACAESTMLELDGVDQDVEASRVVFNRFTGDEQTVEETWILLGPETMTPAEDWDFSFRYNGEPTDGETDLAGAAAMIAGLGQSCDISGGYVYIDHVPDPIWTGTVSGNFSFIIEEGTELDNYRCERQHVDGKFKGPGSFREWD